MSKREKKAKKARKRVRQAKDIAAEAEARRLRALLPPKTPQEQEQIRVRVMQWFSSMRFRRNEPTFKNYVLSDVIVECRDPSQLRALTELAIVEQTKKLPEN